MKARGDVDRLQTAYGFRLSGDYPTIKGFHQALEAPAIIRRTYPDARLVTTTGGDPRARGLRARLRRRSI
jgi:hypothetical protein